jgi:hypothetical protein
MGSCDLKINRKSRHGFDQKSQYSESRRDYNQRYHEQHGPIAPYWRRLALSSRRLAGYLSHPPGFLIKASLDFHCTLPVNGRSSYCQVCQ